MRWPGCTGAPGFVRFSAFFVTDGFGAIFGFGFTVTL